MSEAIALDSLQLGVIRVTGAGAGEFLRAQLSNDVSRLGPDRHFLAAWCDAKGRVQLVVRVAMIGNSYLLILPRELIEPALRRLRMFVLRLDATLSDASDEYQINGVHDSANLPPLNRTENRDGQLWLGLPGSDSHPGRALILTPADQDPPEHAMPTDNDDWALSDIDAGLPQVAEATQGAFVPQMLNLHWLMAVDFGKGCYPGQEVVARLQHRGRLTRRVFRLSWQGRRPAPGESVQADGKTVGTVLKAAGKEKGRLLAVIQIDAASRHALATEDGAALSVCDLPYATPA